MKILFFGTPQFVIPVLEALTKNFDVVAIVTTPDQKAGRKQLLTPPPVKTYAQKHNLTVIQPENNETLKSSILNLESDLFIVAAYGKLIPQEILTIPKYGAINIHPSLLPKYRGPTPIQTALLDGATTTGISFMKIDEQMDHGPILHQIPVTLGKTDTFDWLMQSTFAQAAMILPQVINEYTSGKLQPQPQDDSRATYTKKITKEDGYIDLNLVKSNRIKTQMDRKIRAYYPWPNAWTIVHIRNKPVGIKFLPGEKLQVEGKNPVSIKDFINGYPEMREEIEKLY